MKNFILRTMLMLLVLFSVTGCELIGDIFEAGVAIGVILVLLVVGVIVWIARKFRRRS